MTIHYSRLIGLLGALAMMPALAVVPDSPQEVQPLAVGARAPLFAARTTEGVLRRSGTIRFVYSNPDYTIRLSADALWAAAQPFAMAN